MTIATAYVLGASRSYPIMQLDLKENIQNATSGKVYVKLAPGGQLGAGGALVQKVQGGTIQAAQHSLSNFAPFAQCGRPDQPARISAASNQRFINLVTSDAWKTRSIPKVEASGFKALFYVVHRSARRGGAPGRQAGDHAGRPVGREVPRAGLEDAAAILPHGRRQPDADRLGRDAVGDQAGRGRCARPVGRRALCLRLQGHPEPRHLHPGGARQPGLFAAISNGSTACPRTCRRASSSRAR